MTMHSVLLAGLPLGEFSRLNIFTVYRLHNVPITLLG
jgi:hypothetical protein